MGSTVNYGCGLSANYSSRIDNGDYGGALLWANQEFLSNQWSTQQWPSYVGSYDLACAAFCGAWPSLVASNPGYAPAAPVPCAAWNAAPEQDSFYGAWPNPGYAPAAPVPCAAWNAAPEQDSFYGAWPNPGYAPAAPVPCAAWNAAPEQDSFYGAWPNPGYAPAAPVPCAAWNAAPEQDSFYGAWPNPGYAPAAPVPCAAWNAAPEQDSFYGAWPNPGYAPAAPVPCAAWNTAMMGPHNVGCASDCAPQTEWHSPQGAESLTTAVASAGAAAVQPSVGAGLCAGDTSPRGVPSKVPACHGQIEGAQWEEGVSQDPGPSLVVSRPPFGTGTELGGRSDDCGPKVRVVPVDEIHKIDRSTYKIGSYPTVIYQQTPELRRALEAGDADVGFFAHDCNDPVTTKAGQPPGAARPGSAAPSPRTPVVTPRAAR